MQGYLPGQLYNLSSKYGDKEELMSLVSELKKAGILAICDIVINHRCADAQDEHGIWNKFRHALKAQMSILKLFPLNSQQV